MKTMTIKPAANCLLALVILVAIEGPVFGALHPNHVSLAEIEFDVKRGSFEISLCVWPEDLEKAISEINKSPTPLTSENLKEFVPKYLSGKLFIRSQGQSLNEGSSIRWVGAEIGVQKAWLYFELKPEDPGQFDGTSPIEIENKMFFELYDDQVNHVKFRKKNGRVAWNECSHSTPVRQFEIQ